MNERIKEFISKAQKEIWGNNPYNGSPEFEGYELDAEKFAELLVKECMKVANDHDLGLDIVSTHIKEHFGVE